MTLPRHPGQDDDAPAEKQMSRGTKVLIALAVALVVIMVVLHLTGVIGGH
jgi:hypothetical protein